MMLDPLAEMQVDFESYDIKREASVYLLDQGLVQQQSARGR